MSQDLTFSLDVTRCECALELDGTCSWGGGGGGGHALRPPKFQSFSFESIPMPDISQQPGVCVCVCVCNVELLGYLSATWCVCV